jgi:agmatinase
MRQNFLGLPKELSSYEEASVVVVPVPYEATVSFGGGTARGPEAIIAASQQVELFDEELACEPCCIGIATIDPVDVQKIPPSKLPLVLKPVIGRILDDNKLPLILGGEHSVTPAVLSAFKDRCQPLTVLQFDAHADLREHYEGEQMSHACAMARAREIAPVVHVGIRNLSKEEASLAASEELPIFYAKDMRLDVGWKEKALEAIRTENVYVTIDLDAFDSSVMPATGTPEPGGMDWYSVIDFLKLVASSRRIVGFDIVELAPIEGLHACNFLAAKLAYKCIGFWAEKKKATGQTALG